MELDDQKYIESLLREQQEDEKREEKTFQEFLIAEQLREEQRKKDEEKKNDEAVKSMLELERQKRQQELENKEYPCDICFTDNTIDLMYVLDDCFHRFCFDCMKQFLLLKITDGQTRDIRCPNSKCVHLLTFQEIKQCIGQDKVLFQKYETFLLTAVLNDDPNCRWCPKPGCNTPMIADAGVGFMMICPNPKCKFAFCSNCKESWHADATCEQYKQWKIENSEAAKRFETWAEKNTKKCPKCKSSIEKNGGCNHMTCVHCKHQFCWLCLGLYAAGHFGGSSKCKQFS